MRPYHSAGQLLRHYIQGHSRNSPSGRTGKAEDNIEISLCVTRAQLLSGAYDMNEKSPVSLEDRQLRYLNCFEDRCLV